MTPTKEQLEALAEKHCSRPTGPFDAMYSFELDQLCSYFNERLKLVAGEPVGHKIDLVDSEKTIDNGIMYSTDEVLTPLYSLEIEP